MNNDDFARIGEMIAAGKVLNPYRLWKLTPRPCTLPPRAQSLLK